MMPELGEIDHIEEPYVKAEIVTPSEYVGSIMKLAMEKRGIYLNTDYIDPTPCRSKGLNFRYRKLFSISMIN